MTEPEATDKVTPQERLQAAGEEFGKLNATLPAGMLPMQIPPFLEPTAAIDALVGMLIAQGVIDEQQFIDAKTVRFAELVDALVKQGREVKRKMSGLIVPDIRAPNGPLQQ